MTKAEQRAAILAHVSQHGVTKLPRTRRGWATKPSSPDRLAQVLADGCPCCGEAVTHVENRWGGQLSICNGPTCPARQADSYYFISVSTERDPRQF